MRSRVAVHPTTTERACPGRGRTNLLRFSGAHLGGNVGKHLLALLRAVLHGDALPGHTPRTGLVPQQGWGSSAALTSRMASVE